jgi:hypothetical protein
MSAEKRIADRMSQNRCTMNSSIISFLLLGLALNEARMLDSLAAIESGGQDRAIGRAREVSRYQIMPSLWRRTVRENGWHGSPHDPKLARRVALDILNRRVKRFAEVTHRAPCMEEVYALWTAPGLLVARGWQWRRLPAKIKERCIRFNNLYSAP